ncbi:hypothetical protein SUDANB111_00504 [Streptomyces sp. enrichment culture]
MAAANSRKGRLAATVRQSAATARQAGPALRPAGGRAGRARAWSTARAPKTTAATVHTAPKSQASRASPASGPIRMPAW